MPRKKRPKSLSREELYERIWATGVYRLAKELGFSGPGLLKICRRHDIPTPSAGYWTKLRRGKPVSRPALPIGEKYSTAAFPVALPRPKSKAVGSSFSDARLVRLGAEESRRPTIAVPETLLAPQEAIDRTRRALQAAAQSTCSRRRSLLYPLSAEQQPMLEVSVSEPRVNRALAVLGSLLQACAERGYQLVPAKYAWERGLRILALDEFFYARIREFCRRTPRQLSAADAAHIPGDASGFTPARLECAPTGMLQLEVGRYSSPDVVIRDTPYRRVEDGLNRVMVAILRCVDEKRKNSAGGRRR